MPQVEIDAAGGTAVWKHPAVPIREPRQSVKKTMTKMFLQRARRSFKNAVLADRNSTHSHQLLNLKLKPGGMVSRRGAFASAV